MWQTSHKPRILRTPSKCCCFRFTTLKNNLSSQRCQEISHIWLILSNKPQRIPERDPGGCKMLHELLARLWRFLFPLYLSLPSSILDIYQTCGICVLFFCSVSALGGEARIDWRNVSMSDPGVWVLVKLGTYSNLTRVWFCTRINSQFYNQRR